MISIHHHHLPTPRPLQPLTPTRLSPLLPLRHPTFLLQTILKLWRHRDLHRYRPIFLLRGGTSSRRRRTVFIPRIRITPTRALYPLLCRPLSVPAQRIIPLNQRMATAAAPLHSFAPPPLRLPPPSLKPNPGASRTSRTHRPQKISSSLESPTMKPTGLLTLRSALRRRPRYREGTEREC